MVYRTNETLSDMFDERNAESLCKTMGDGWMQDRMKKSDTKELKAICESCPVLATCQKIARVYDEFTFLGGETPRERRVFRQSADYYRLLEQAAKEGWLDRSIAVATQEDITDAILLSKRIKPALITDWVIEEIQIDVLVDECFLSAS